LPMIIMEFSASRFSFMKCSSSISTSGICTACTTLLVSSNHL
jgi:hypothetical protein